MTVDVRMSERALREVYLKPFQMAVKNGDPKILMTSYNKVNGTHVSENSPLLQDIVRKDWAFDGLVMSDWCDVTPTPLSLSLRIPPPSSVDSQSDTSQVRRLFLRRVHQRWRRPRNAGSLPPPQPSG